MYFDTNGKPLFMSLGSRRTNQPAVAPYENDRVLERVVRKAQLLASDADITDASLLEQLES